MQKGIWQSNRQWIPPPISFCLKKTESGQYALKEDIKCKGRCIFLAGRFTNLLCGHLKDVVVLKIAKDKAWKENISELVQFYFEHLFPKIIEGQL